MSLVDAMPPVSLLLEKYLGEFPSEAEHLAALIEFVEATPHYRDQIRRSNMVGHLTASGLIVDQSHARVLLVEHRTLKKRLQPGGHIEPSDASLLAAAYREIQEETGLVADDLQLVTLGRDSSLPVDINSHLIPASVAKGEGEHLHHDLRFLFVLTRPQPAVLRSPEDGSELIWERLERAFTGDSQQHLPRKLHELLAAPPPH